MKKRTMTAHALGVSETRKIKYKLRVCDGVEKSLILLE